MKKVLSVLLAVLLLAVMLPLTALAEDQVSHNFAVEDSGSGEGWVWNKETKTLTLTDATMRDFYLPAGSTIVLNGTNYVGVDDEGIKSYHFDYHSGDEPVRVSDTVIITGTGSLTVSGGSWANFLVESGTVDFICLNDAIDGSIEVRGGNVRISAGFNNEVNPATAISGNAVVSGGSLTVHSNGEGIIGTLTVSGGSAAVTAKEECVVEGLNVSGGDVALLRQKPALIVYSLEDFEGISTTRFATMSVTGGTVFLSAPSAAAWLREAPTIGSGMVVTGSNTYAADRDSLTAGVRWEYVVRAEGICPVMSDDLVRTLLITAGSGGDITVRVPEEQQPNPTTGAADSIGVTAALAAAVALTLTASALIRKK